MSVARTTRLAEGELQHRLPLWSLPAMSRGISVGPTGTTDEGDSRAGCCRGRVKAPLAIHTQYRYKVVCSPPRRGCGGRWRPSGMEQQPLSALAIAALATPAPSDNPPKPPPIRHAATPCTPQPPTAEASHAALPKPFRPRCSRHRWPGTASLSPAAPRGTPTGGNHHEWVHRLSPSLHLEEGKGGTPTVCHGTWFRHKDRLWRKRYRDGEEPCPPARGERKQESVPWRTRGGYWTTWPRCPCGRPPLQRRRRG